MAYYDAWTGDEEEDEDPYSPNYGAGAGQFSPYTDSAAAAQPQAQAQPRTGGSSLPGEQDGPVSQPYSQPAPSKSADRAAVTQGSLAAASAGVTPPSLRTGGYPARDTAGDASTLGPSTDFSRQGQTYNSAQGTYSQPGSARATATAPQGSGYTLSGQGGSGASNYGYAGFNFGQDAGNRDTGKSAKYAFAEGSRLAAEQGAVMPRTKQEAEQWFNQYISPYLTSQGYTVGQVIGDKAEIGGWQGNGFVDFLQDADGANPMLAWQPDSIGGDPMAMNYGGAAQGGDPAAMNLAQQLGIDTNDPLWEKILNDLLNGGDGNGDGSVAGLSPATSDSFRY
jgi:hypothetical protein